MSYRIVIKEGALQDAIDGYLYYEELQLGLGERFLDELNARYNQIRENPQYYGYASDGVSPNVRDVALDGFPYLVVFEIFDEEVIVYAIHNTYKKPRLF
jgi:hypothetical protein